MLREPVKSYRQIRFFFEELFAESGRCFHRVAAAPGASKTYTATELAEAILPKIRSSQILVWATPNREQAKTHSAVLRASVDDDDDVGSLGRTADSDATDDRNDDWMVDAHHSAYASDELADVLAVVKNSEVMVESFERDAKSGGFDEPEDLRLAIEHLRQAKVKLSEKQLLVERAIFAHDYRLSVANSQW